MKLVKLITAATLLVLSPFALANVDAKIKPYAGLDLGYANMNVSKSDLGDYTVGSINDTGFAGRIYGGVQFNQYVAAEAGFSRFPEVKFKNISILGRNANMSYNTYAIDLVAKGILPIADHFDAFGKAGVAWEHATEASATVNGLKFTSDASQDKFTPTVGAGVEYNFNDNWAANVAYNHLFKVDDLNAIDFYSVGVKYSF